MNIFLGLLFIIGGAVIIYFSRKFKYWFGRWGFAEQYLGGTDQGYVLIGFGMMLLGILALFGVVNLAK